MKLLFYVAAFLCLLSYSYAAINIDRADTLFEEVKNTPLVQSNPALVERVRERVKVKGCSVNLCFALDGSGSVGDDFQTQKDFVKLIGAIVGADTESQFAATVYGLVNKDISKLTSNAEKFLLDVCDARFPSAKTTFISAGLGFCFNQLNDPPVFDDVNKIVLMGDGFANFGDLEGPLAPVSIAQQWRDLAPNNFLCAVAVGFRSTRALNAITGDPALVLEVTDWPILLNILDSLVDSICFRDVKPTTKPPTTTKPITTKPAPKCPCKCRSAGTDARARRKAERQCFRAHYSHCKVTQCGFKAYQCCH